MDTQAGTATPTVLFVHTLHVKILVCVYLYTHYHTFLQNRSFNSANDDMKGAR